MIKGSVSSLYGASALGGVINLVSRTPGEAPYAEVLFNATTRDGQDVTSFASTPLSDALAVSLTTGAHRQSLVDIDDDGWIDMPGYERFTARPRFHYEGEDGSSAYLTFGFMTEQRDGGPRARRAVDHRYLAEHRRVHRERRRPVPLRGALHTRARPQAFTQA